MQLFYRAANDLCHSPIQQGELDQLESPFQFELELRGCCGVKLAREWTIMKPEFLGSSHFEEAKEGSNYDHLAQGRQTQRVTGSSSL